MAHGQLLGSNAADPLVEVQRLDWHLQGHCHRLTVRNHQYIEDAALSLRRSYFQLHSSLILAVNPNSCQQAKLLFLDICQLIGPRHDLDPQRALKHKGLYRQLTIQTQCIRTLTCH